MPDSSGSIDLGALSAEDVEKIERMAEETEAEPGKYPALFAFLVIADPEGNVSFYAYDGPENAPDLDVQVPVTHDLVYGAAAAIQKDISAQETAQHTLRLQMSQAQAMAQKMQEQQLLQNLDLRGGQRG